MAAPVQALMQIDLSGERGDGLWLLGEVSRVKKAGLRSRDKAFEV